MTPFHLTESVGDHENPLLPSLLSIYKRSRLHSDKPTPPHGFPTSTSLNTHEKNNKNTKSYPPSKWFRLERAAVSMRTDSVPWGREGGHHGKLAASEPHAEIHLTVAIARRPATAMFDAALNPVNHLTPRARSSRLVWTWVPGIIWKQHAGNGWRLLRVFRWARLGWEPAGVLWWTRLQRRRPPR